MSMKTVLVTGSTDGIGLETARKLAALGHTVLLHGRSETKLADALATVSSGGITGTVKCFSADLSRFNDVEALARSVRDEYVSLDVLVNNAGVFMTRNTRTQEGLDVRFMVNTIAPYLLTRRFLPCMPTDGRVINLSSAAQSPVDLGALAGKLTLSDNAAYAQSKLAITAWSRVMAAELGDEGPVVAAVNPGSLLATKMVQQAYGMPGKDSNIGSDILVRAAVSAEFASATGKYFDNDTGRFNSPHPDALNARKGVEIVSAIETIIGNVVRSTE